MNPPAKFRCRSSVRSRATATQKKKSCGWASSCISSRHPRKITTLLTLAYNVGRGTTRNTFSSTGYLCSWRGEEKDEHGRFRCRLSSSFSSPRQLPEVPTRHKNVFLIIHQPSLLPAGGGRRIFRKGDMPIGLTATGLFFLSRRSSASNRATATKFCRRVHRC